MTAHRPPIFASVDTDDPCFFCGTDDELRDYCAECEITHCVSHHCQAEHFNTCRDAAHQMRDAGHAGIGLLIVLAVLAVTCGYSVTGHLWAAVVVIVGFVALALAWVLWGEAGQR